MVLSNASGASLVVRSSETIGSLSGGGNTGGNVALASGSTLTVAEAGSTSYVGTQSGSGSGTITLSGNSSSYSGASAIDKGTVVAAANSAWGSGAVNMSTAGLVAGNGVSLANDIVVGSAFVTTSNYTNNAFSGYWSFGSVTNVGSASVTSTTDSGVTYGDVLQGNTLGTATMLSTSSASTGYTGSLGPYERRPRGGTNALVTGASGSAYFEFTVTPTAGSSLSLTNFTVGSRQSGSGRLLMTLLSSLDSYTTASGGQATFSGVISGAGLVTKTGSGTVTFAGSAANTFSGATTVSDGTLELASTTASSLGSTASVSVASGATLLVSQANQVNNSASVSLTGGTIRTASGVSEVFGNLSLASASFLDFSTTSHANANSISFGTYMPSALLTINNFNFGSTPVFGSNLTSTINNSSLFTFNNGGISSYTWDSVGSTFTITAIPEPSTCLAAVGLLGLMLWPARRRLIGRA